MSGLHSNHYDEEISVSALSFRILGATDKTYTTYTRSWQWTEDRPHMTTGSNLLPPASDRIMIDDEVMPDGGSKFDSVKCGVPSQSVAHNDDRCYVGRVAVTSIRSLHATSVMIYGADLCLEFAKKTWVSRHNLPVHKYHTVSDQEQVHAVFTHTQK